MKQPVEDEVALRRYLLGYLTPEEQMQVEERLFLENDYFQRLQGAEEELIDDYVAAELSANEKERFREVFLLKPERYEALRIATALRKYILSNAEAVSPPPEIKAPIPALSKAPLLSFLRLNKPTPKLLFLAAMLLLMFGGLWIVIKIIRKPGDSAPGQAQRQSPQEKENKLQPQSNVGQDGTADSNTNAPSEPSQTARQQNPPRSIGEGETGAVNESEQNNQARKPVPSTHQLPVRYAFLLSPGGAIREGGDVDALPIHTDAGVVNLQLLLIGDMDYSSYRATLAPINQTPLLTRTGLKATTTNSGEIISLKVPAKLLRQQKYRVALSGITANGDVREISAYFFKVAKN